MGFTHCAECYDTIKANLDNKVWRRLAVLALLLCELLISTTAQYL